MQESRHVIDYNNFTSVCRKNNIRLTPQRIAIFNCISKLSNHPTAEAVYNEIHEQFPNISYDTVNRTLLKFFKIGIIDITEGIGIPRRFDPSTEHHHHFHCVKCGNIVDFNYNNYDNLELPGKLTSKHQVLQQRVILKGICSTCKEKT